VGSVVVSVGAVVALVILGGLLGAWIDAGRTRSAVDPSVANSQPAGGAERRGPEPQPPLSGSSDRPGGPPQLQVNQSMGDGNTVFVLHGRGWEPGSQVAVRLAGGRPSYARTVVDMAGTFNYAVNQHHEFFPGPLPAGEYTAQATAPDGARGEAHFSVHP
jgi:hypothetical protein